tara:strand:- start:10402 stop:12207 length:1806 start_codon:yes stop_codon:yes gene_type:complete
LRQKQQALSLLGQHNSTFKHLDKLIPANILLDVSERFKARTLIIMIGILFSISIVSMTLIIVVDESLPIRRLITITLISLQPIAIWFMWLKKRTVDAAWFVVSLLAITIMFIDYNNQSFKGAYSILWILPPTITVMLLGGRAALKITVVSMIAMSLNFFLLKLNLLPPPITPQAKLLNVEFVISITVILIVSFSVFALSRMTTLKEKELSLEIESRKRIAKKLEEARDVAQQAAKNKSMFLATMSHELRTPLNSILGNAELLSRDKLEDKTKGRINDIYSAGQLLISIINDVLDLSKFDTYGISLNDEVYDISSQIKRIHRMMESKVKPSVEFIIEGVDEPIIIKADQNRISQIILNLVSNAVKFTEVGCIKLSVARDSDKSIKIVVSDTGVGISDEDAKTLFHDFIQIRKNKNQQVEGTGLGLAIIQRIVDRMAGIISLESIEGKGSTFTVKLPFDLVSSDQIDEFNISQQRQTPIEHDLSSLSILIVDDVAMNCIILKALLEELGVKNIQEEHDGEEAVELIKQGNQFDVILMDIRMPKMDGLEASQLIRGLAYKKAIIAVTANAFEEDKKACLDSGMDGFLSKPVEIDKLKEILESIA